MACVQWLSIHILDSGHFFQNCVIAIGENYIFGIGHWMLDVIAMIRTLACMRRGNDECFSIIVGLLILIRSFLVSR